ncbi:MFS transporter [Bradyrhizobium sp. 142]|nr:MFS transporter [Bradyrhizobium sp. 142]
MTAASATFALKAGVWFRRARLLIVSPDSRDNLARRQAETPLIALFRFAEPALITGRDGPVVIEIEYRVMQRNAPGFRDMMQDLRLVRQRNGAYGWSIARNMADPDMWIERYHFHTWHDYLRQRNRSTQTERALEARIIKEYHEGPGKVRVRRTIERSFG